MKKVIVLLLLVFLTSCFDFKSHMNFKFDGLKLSELIGVSSESYRIVGSYYFQEEPVVSQYHIGEFRLSVIKIKNLSKNVKFISELKKVRHQSGEIINGKELDFLYSTEINTNKESITQIDINSNRLLEKIIENDSIKNYYINADEFRIMLNDKDNLVISGYSEYEDISDVYFDVLFYKIENEVYVFIMNSGDAKKPIKKRQLYNYLFKNTLPI